MMITNKFRSVVHKLKSLDEAHKIQGADSIKAPGIINKSSRLNDVVLSEDNKKKLEDMKIKLEGFIKDNDAIEVIIVLMNIKNLSPENNLEQLLGGELYNKSKEVTSGKDKENSKNKEL